MDTIKNSDLRALVLAYLSRIVALDQLASGKASLSVFVAAERALWHSLISNPYGSMFAGLIGGALVTWADSVLSIPHTEEATAKTNMGMGQIALAEAAVQIVLRVEGGDTVSLRKAISDKLLALSAEAV